MRSGGHDFCSEFRQDFRHHNPEVAKVVKTFGI
jgi:hypothetical protein